MKRILLSILVLLFAVGAFAGSIQAPTGFAGQLWNNTFALYGSRNTKTHFLCTAEPIAKIDGGYQLLTAGHCVQLVPADIQFSVSDEIGSPRTNVTLVKAVLGGGMDFAIFDLKTSKKYTPFVLGDESELKIGDGTINPNFALGANKQLSYGTVSSMVIPTSEECAVDECSGTFIVQEYAGPGASGSAVLSAKTHKVVGVLVWEFEEGKPGFGVEPISNFAKFMAGPNQPHPGTKAAVVTIPSDVFAARFGESHPFKLGVQGPNPVFVQGGYKFRAETDGFELSDDYYYNVPVYIDQDDEGYRLTSTMESVSVALTVLGKE